MVRFEPTGDLNDPNAGLIDRLAQRFKHLFGWSLLIDIEILPAYIVKLGIQSKYRVKEKWVKLSRSDIAYYDYTPCIGYKDSIDWIGVPTYCRIHGGIVPPNIDDQSATRLNDCMKNDATKKFEKSLGKGQLSKMDTQKLILLGVLGVGAVLALWFTGVI